MNVIGFGRIQYHVIQHNRFYFNVVMPPKARLKNLAFGGHLLYFKVYCYKIRIYKIEWMQNTETQKVIDNDIFCIHMLNRKQVRKNEKILICMADFTSCGNGYFCFDKNF